MHIRLQRPTEGGLSFVLFCFIPCSLLVFIVFDRLESFELSTFEGGRGIEQPGGEGGEDFQDLRRGDNQG